MAILSSDGNSVTAQWGDTMWGIAATYLGSGLKYQELADINGISNPNLIYVGQVIKLRKTTSSSGSSGSTGGSSSGSTSSNKGVGTLTIDHFGLQSNTDGTLFATWTWSQGNTDHYETLWEYDTGDGVWFIGSRSTTTETQCTYNIPSNAKVVRFKAKPVSKTYTVNNKETSYWTSNWSATKTHNVAKDPPKKPSAPTVTMDKFKLTAKIENVTECGSVIEFQVYQNDGSTVFATGKANITATNTASYSCNVNAGGSYKVRCRGIDGSVTGEWSDFSSGVTTLPSASSGITVLKAKSETSVYLEWGASSTAETYTIEYATKEDYFDGSDAVSSKTGIEFTHYEIVGLESGQEYFFRVCAVNSNGMSEWSKIKSIVIGKKPSAPTTWSSTTTCITGEALKLYWVHNSEDGSSQTYAELELYINGTKETHTIKNNNTGDDIDNTSTYTIDTSKYTVGSKIQWRVRTSGVTKEYGDWSVQRTIDIYAPPTLELSMTDIDGNQINVLTSFPFYISGIPGPKTQSPVSYQLTVTSNDTYESTDNIGNRKVVSAGDQVYTGFFDTIQSLLVELSAGNIDLENNVKYTVSCLVSMDSGLTAESSLEFTVQWTDEMYIPNADIGYDKDAYTTHIRPYCVAYQTRYMDVEYSTSRNEYITSNNKLDPENIDNVYSTTGEKILVGITARGTETYYGITYVDSQGNPIDPIYYGIKYSNGAYTRTDTILDPKTIKPVLTTTGEEVYVGKNQNGDELRYCIISSERLIDDITLSVYRREFDGSFTELATGLKNTQHTYVTDPHPAMDYARYRIVAITDNTGAVSYYDAPGYPIGEPGAILQWDEDWTNFDTDEESELTEKPWTGSLVRLLYNLDVSDDNSVDTSLVKYIGRKRPVSYYGTQLGETSTWNTEIPKDDLDTLYALRRLAIWTGNVYVRESSGTGYWANVNVSYSSKHKEVTIPISLSITRVEGGA